MSQQENDLFTLMAHAEDLQREAAKVLENTNKAAQRLEREAVTAFSVAMRESVSKTLGDTKKELTEAVQAAKEASEIARSGARRFVKLVSVYAFFVLLLVAVGLGGFSWLFVSWKAEEAAVLRAEISALNADLAKLPKVYDNIKDTPGVWVVIDPGAKPLQLQTGETIARLPRR